MFAALATAFVVVFCLVTLVIPYRCTGRFKRLVRRIRDRVIGHAMEARLSESRIDDEKAVAGLRIWGVIAALIFAVFGLLDGAVIRDHPNALAVAGVYSIASIAISGLAVVSVFACATVFPRTRDLTTLNRCGLGGIWLVDRLRPNPALRDALLEHALSTSRIGIVDVTGYEILGRGSGVTGGVLYDALARCPEVPVFLLLCKPEAQAVDPERRRSSVIETLLAEMKMAHATYLHRLRSTMDAVDALNRARPEYAQISVRFYNEKPTFESIIFDDACFAIPWHPRPERAEIPYVEQARCSEDVSFYESYRRHFGRLWGKPISGPEAETHKRQALIKNGSFRTQKSQKSERPLSGSFAIKPAAGRSTQKV